MKTEELMTQPVVICSVDDHLDRAAQRMWDHDCGALPVVDGEGQVVAVITDRDICMAAWSTGQPLHEIPVRTAMSNQLVCCHPQDSAQALVRAMTVHRIRRVPIVDEGRRPIGIVSLSDVTRNTARVRHSTSWAEARDLMQTMASICEPRTATVPSTADGSEHSVRSAPLARSA